MQLGEHLVGGVENHSLCLYQLRAHTFVFHSVTFFLYSLQSGVILFMPNQLNNAEGIFFVGILYLFTHRMNLIKMQILILWVKSICFLWSWFGDYRSLRFLCGYFDSRTFYFGRSKDEKMDYNYCGYDTVVDDVFLPARTQFKRFTFSR